MKKFYATIIGLILPLAIFCQNQSSEFTDDNREPQLIRMFSSLKKEMPVEMMPSFDVKALMKEDSEIGASMNGFRYGICFDKTLSMSSGRWTDIGSGRIWGLTIKSPEAHSINLTLKDVKMPLGAVLYLLGCNTDVLYDVIKSEDIPDTGVLPTDIIQDDAITIVLYEPMDCEYQTSFTISNIVHGYKDIPSFFQTNELESSNFEDVSCHDEYISEARAVVQLIGLTPGYACSGALIMNTNNDLVPYVLTAFHCMDANTDNVLSSSEKANCSTVLVRFNKRSYSCDANYPCNAYETIVGSIFRAGWADTDFLLLELPDPNNAIKNSTKLAWLGWDRTLSTPTSGFSIHHPNDEYQKISISYNPFYSSDRNGSLSTEHWVANFNIGEIDYGSSGSPLLNQNKRVVGQLHGNYGNNYHEGWYGKFSTSWEGGGTNETRLKDWLDPIGSNRTMMGSPVPTSNSQYHIEHLLNGFSVSWSYSPTNGSLTFNTSGNTCTLSNTNKEYVKGTLTANIYYNGSCIKTLTKTIDSAANFYGTYSQEGGQVYSFIDGTSYYDPIPATFFGDNSSVELHKQLTATINSPLFGTCTLARTNGNGILPATWHQNGSTITYNPPRNGPVMMSITGTGINSYDVFRFTVGLAPEPLIEGINLDLQSGDGTLMLTLTKDSAEAGIDGNNLSDRSAINDASDEADLEAYINSLVWHVIISNIQTGAVVFNGNVTGQTTTIPTVGWPTGIYAVRAEVEGVQLTSKTKIR